MTQDNSGNKGNQQGKQDRSDFIKSDVKPERYERPTERPAPSPPPPPKKDDE